MKKSQLKEKGSYYYECKDFYGACPNTLPIIPPARVEIFPRTMTHAEILKEYKIIPYNSYAEAVAALIPLIPDLKLPSRIVYFKEDEILFRFHAWRFGGGQLSVYVDEVFLDREYDAERGVVFSNGHLDALSNSSLDSLSLPKELIINGITYIQK